MSVDHEMHAQSLSRFVHVTKGELYFHARIATAITVCMPPPQKKTMWKMCPIQSGSLQGLHSAKSADLAGRAGNRASKTGDCQQ